MGTAAACRTFNVLASEGRQVTAVLLLEEAVIKLAPAKTSRHRILRQLTLGHLEIKCIYTKDFLWQ